MMMYALWFWGLLACSCHDPKTAAPDPWQTIQPQVDLYHPDIVVLKSERLLAFYEDDQLKVVNDEKMIWPISLGGEPEGHKTREGDQHTPEGLYNFSDHSTHSKFVGSLLIHYPNTADAKQGLADGVISSTEFVSIQRAEKFEQIPSQETALGSYLLVHGTWKANTIADDVRFLQTDGCVGMSNSDILELRELLPSDMRGQILILP